jgi:hypothetical protein
MSFDAQFEKNNTLILIKKILKSNSQKFKMREKIDIIYNENKFLIDYYNSLAELNNNYYYHEVIKFNKIRKKYLETYTGEIELENKYFQPYEYLPFEESKCFKKFYIDNWENIDKVYNLIYN